MADINLDFVGPDQRLAFAASGEAKKQATLAGHYANDATDTDVPGGSAGSRGAKWWSMVARGSVGASTSSGTLPPAAGNAATGGFSIVDATPFGQAGVLVDLAVYALLDCWAIPFVCTLNGDGTVRLDEAGVPNRLYAGQAAYFPSFTPTVSATQYVGFLTDVGNSLSRTDPVAGKALWIVGSAKQLPGAASSKTISANTRLQVGWTIAAPGLQTKAARGQKSGTVADFAVGGAAVMQGIYPTIDGDGQYGSGNLSVMMRDPALYDGVVSAASIYLAGSGTGYFFVGSYTATGQIKVEAIEAGVRTFAVGVSTFTDLVLPIKRGQFFGCYTTATFRSQTGDVGGFFLSGAPGALGDLKTFSVTTASPRMGFVITPPISAEVARAVAAEAGLQDQITGSLTTYGTTADGTTTPVSGGLCMFTDEAVARSGRLKQFTVFSAVAASASKLVVASRNGSGQFTLLSSVDISIVPGLNTFPVNVDVSAGSYLGVYSTGSPQRYTGSGGAGARWTTGLPTTNTPTSAVAAGLKMAYGWTIQTGIGPKVGDVEARVATVEAGLASVGTQTLLYRPFDAVSFPVAKGTKSVIAWNGQSNSASTYQGSTPSAALSTTQLFSNVMLSSGSFVPLVSVSTEKSHVTAANFATVRRIRDTGGAPGAEVLTAFTAGVLGASITAIQSGSSGYNDFISQVTAMRSADTGIKVPIMDFVQGETDNQANMAQATWKAAMVTLRNDLETSVRGVVGGTDTLHVVMMQPSAQVAGGGPGPVLAQLELAQSDGRYSLAGAPMYRFPHSTFDNIHLTNVGFKLQGAYFGKANAALLAGKRPQWINPISATYDGAVVTIVFDVPVRPLIFDPATLGATTNQGFKVLDGGAAATISSVVISDNRVVITCAAAFTGAVEVRYALDYLGAGRNISGGASGTLRDSDPDSITIAGVSYQLFACAPHFRLTAANVRV